MSVQTADENMTIIHMTPVHQLTSYELKSCVYKTKIQNVNFKHYFLPKYESIIHNAFSSEKVNILKYVCNI